MAKWGIGRRLALYAAVAAAMVLPLLAPERLTGGVMWDPEAFVFLSILMIGLGAVGEVAARIGDRRAYAAGAGLAVFTGLAQAWVNLAVGIIGNEENPANLIYFAVIAVAAVGALVARLRPAGMAKAMVAAAVAQCAAFAIALIAGFSFTGPITIFFLALWLIAAWLFRRADEARTTLSL